MLHVKCPYKWRMLKILSLCSLVTWQGLLQWSVMSRILHYGSRLAALGVAAGTGWWLGSTTSRESGGLPEGLIHGVFGKVSAAALQGYSMQPPAEVPQLDPAAPRVTQVRLSLLMFTPVSVPYGGSIKFLFICICFSYRDTTYIPHCMSIACLHYWFL